MGVARCMAFVCAMLFIFSLAVASPLGTTESTSGSANTTTHDTPPEAKRGWTESPNERGTIDILWSSLFTMFLCSWSILCMNVPSPNDSTIRIFHRRFWLTCLCFLGPEFTTLSAAGQWVSARRSVEAFAHAGIEGWTMYHGFFADMGGWMLHARDSKPFPVDSKQLLFLVQNKFVDKPDLDRKSIADKNKVDGMLRIITIFQVLWFVINIIGRQAQDLAITCIEITAAAFIVCTLATVAFWIHKPADVRIPDRLECAAPIAEVVDAAVRCFPDALHRTNPDLPGEPPRHEHYYGKTPLDFVSRKEWHWSLYWTNWINILRHMGINFAPKVTPVDRFENTTFLEVPPKVYVFWLATTAAYTSIFALAWNYDFPTTIERTLWRVSSLSVIGSLVAFSAITEFTYSIYPAIARICNHHLRRRSSRNANSSPLKSDRRTGSKLREKLGHLAAHVRNNTPDKDPALEVPLKALLPLYVTATIYCVSRTYILLSDLLELRALPICAYKTVDWSAYLPHL